MTAAVQVDLGPLVSELGDDVVVTDPERMDKYRWDRANDPDAGWMGGPRLLMFFWTAMVCASFSAFGWFTFFGRFSAEAWNSRHFN